MVRMTILARYRALIQYLKGSLSVKDWHAVRDACVDLEVMEAKYPGLRKK